MIEKIKKLRETRDALLAIVGNCPEADALGDRIDRMTEAISTQGCNSPVAYDASPKALHKAYFNLTQEVFKKLEIGKCFLWKFEDVKETYLRNRASIVGKQIGRKFRVIKHKNNQIFEIARIK